MRKFDKRVHIMLNDTELSALKKKSADAGMTMSAYLRKQIMETTIRERPNIDWRSLADRIGTLGDEVNEIARAVNARGIVTECDSKQVLEIMQQIKAELAFLAPYAQDRKDVRKERK